MGIQQRPRRIDPSILIVPAGLVCFFILLIEPRFPAFLHRLEETADGMFHIGGIDLDGFDVVVARDKVPEGRFYGIIQFLCQLAYILFARFQFFPEIYIVR